MDPEEKDSQIKMFEDDLEDSLLGHTNQSSEEEDTSTGSTEEKKEG